MIPALNLGSGYMPAGLAQGGAPIGKCKQCRGEGGFMTSPHLAYSRRWHRCSACDGTGDEADEPVEECLDCGERECVCGEDDVEELYDKEGTDSASGCAIGARGVRAYFIPEASRPTNTRAAQQGG